MRDGKVNGCIVVAGSKSGSTGAGSRMLPFMDCRPNSAVKYMSSRSQWLVVKVYGVGGAGGVKMYRERKEYQVVSRSDLALDVDHSECS